MNFKAKTIVLACLASSVALAQPGADEALTGEVTGPPAAPVEAAPTPPPPPPAEPPPEARSTVDKGTILDANAGRSFLAPTALTEPAGTWSFSDYELMFAGLSYSATDQLSLSATVLLPIYDGTPFVGLFNAKYQILRSGPIRGALQAAFATVDGASAAVLGGALTVCIDTGCRSTLNGYVGAGFAYEDQSVVPLTFAGSVVYAVSDHVKLLVEANTLYLAGGGINAAVDGLLAWYGVRFTSKNIGVDLGFMKPLCDGCDEIPLTMGFPFASFTYRSLK
jgi:hypothetical protein